MTMIKIGRLSMVALLALAGLLLGCNSGSNAAGVDVSGTWTLNVDGETSSMTLQQNGDALSGSVQGAPLTGSVNGNNISITSGFSGGPLLVADGTVDGLSMSGSYTATEAGGTQHTGTWSATKP